MTDPVYGVIITGVLVALLTAMLIPPPAHPVDEEGGVGAALLGAACAAVIAMGILALHGHHAESVLCGAVAWLLVMPCVWLSRAPRPAGGWTEEEDEDDGGGSPRPQRPSDPPAPDDGLSGLPPPAPSPAARAAAWTVPAPATVLPTAARAQLLLAAHEAEKLHGAQEVRWRLATAATALARAQPDEPEAHPQPDAQPAPEPPSPTAPLHTPAIARLSQAPRPRGDHRAFASLLAAVRRACPALPRHAPAPRGHRERQPRPAPGQR